METAQTLTMRVLAASLISPNLCNLEAQVRALEGCSVRALHVDLLDGASI